MFAKKGLRALKCVFWVIRISHDRLFVHICFLMKRNKYGKSRKAPASVQCEDGTLNDSVQSFVWHWTFILVFEIFV
jgi:hypothetical protein